MTPQSKASMAFLVAILALAPNTIATAAVESPDDDSSDSRPIDSLAQLPDSLNSVKSGPEPAELSTASPTDDVIPLVAEKIFDLGAGNGFAGQHTDYTARSITVFWKGSPPESVVEFLDSQPLGVSIALQEGAPYSREDGNVARARLLEDPISNQLGIQSASVSSEGKGLTLGVSVDAATAAKLAEEAKRVAGIEAITITPDVDPLPPYAGSRADDDNPYKAGGRIEIPYYNAACSTGFSVLEGSAGRLLSARHCNVSGGHSIVDGGGDSMAPAGGSWVRVRSAIDSMLIDPKPSPASRYLAFRGGWSSSLTYTVKNWYSNWTGDPVCASGATLGEHCGTVYDDNTTHLINGVHVPSIGAKAPNGSVLAGTGDSGGPIYKKVTGGVQARGIVLGPDPAHSDTSNCGTTDPNLSVRCSKYIHYVPISTILNAWGVTLHVN